MADDLEETLFTIANIVYDNVKQFGIGDRAYERAMSEELIDRAIRHEVHKKVYDERKGKYKFIDLYFPEHARFAKLKARKYITRTEIAELKEEEQVMGIEGMIINFYNGVSIRHTHSGKVRGSDFDSLIGYHPESHPRQQPKSRMTLPQLSGSTSRLSDIGASEPPTFGPRGPKYNSRYPVTVPPLSDERGAGEHNNSSSFRNANKIFSLSCAAFFFSEGDRREFAVIFNDLLETMKLTRITIPEKFLEGPRLRTPDGELSEALKKAFSTKLKLSQEQSAQNSPEKKSAAVSNGSESPPQNGNVENEEKEA